MKKFILGILCGLIISGGIVYAASIFASDIDYDNSNSHLKKDNNQDVTNVQEAIDALYAKANSGGSSMPVICTFDSNNYVSQANKDNHLSEGTKYYCEVGDNIYDYFYVLTVNPNSVDLLLSHNLSNVNVNFQNAIEYFRSGNGTLLKNSWSNVINVDLPTIYSIVDNMYNKGNGWNSYDSSIREHCFATHTRDLNSSPWCNLTTNEPYMWMAGGDGYWTNDIVNDYSSAWYIHSSGMIDTMRFQYSLGIRPVITVLKSQLN